jgi:hypothetical protein
MSKKIVFPLLVSVFVAAAIFLWVGTYQVVTAAGFEQRGGFGSGGPAGEELAEALGITVAELETAYQEASDAAIQQALEQGLITEQQAEQMRSSERFAWGMHFGGRMWGAGNIDFQALLADALGITVDELAAAQQIAHEARLAQAVADGRITQQQADLMQARQRLHTNENFRSALRSAYESAVNKAVEEGVITQEQAEQILSSESSFGMRGFGKGGRGMRGWGACPGAPSE